MSNKKLVVVSCYSVCLLISIGLNIFLVTKPYLQGRDDINGLIKKRIPAGNKLSWTQRAAEEAEAVASISCSGHGRAFLDGLVQLNDGKPACECNSCYGGDDCSVLSLDCVADADSGDPLFLEPFWIQHPESSAVLISGWHRMSYSFTYDHSSISKELEIHIRRVHKNAKNAITKGKYILFGGGSTQLLGAAVYALSMNLSSPASVVAASPAYPLYKAQTDYFETKNFEYEGDAWQLIKNKSSSSSSGYTDSMNVIEFVTSPNNPDGNLREPVSQGPSTKLIYDHAYYWPHFTAIPSPANGDVMIFTMSKLTGHAGSRFGWAIVKDYDVYQNMATYIALAEMGIGKEVQLRALKLMKTVLEGNNGTEIFNYAYGKMSRRWKALSDILSASKRFSLQKIPPLYCNYFQKIRGPSPAYAWLKCEREKDTDCNAVLSSAKIIGRSGSLFSAEDRYVRLSLLKSDDDFNLLLNRLKDLVASEYGPKII